MPFWKRLLEILHLPAPTFARRRFELNEGVLRSLHDLAEREQRPADEVAERLLVQALKERQTAEDSLQRWRDLTPREQQVVALICLDYTTRQIAARLMISPETVKSHAHNALYKFGAHNRKELRMVLSSWDFSRWEDSL